jgi:hypothetical protein
MGLYVETITRDGTGLRNILSFVAFHIIRINVGLRINARGKYKSIRDMYIVVMWK